jgi:hypothetical protein
MPNNNDKLLEHIAAEVQSIQVRLDKCNETLASNTASLVQHMEQTMILKEEVRRVEAEVRPIKMHVAFVGAAGKIITLVGALLGIAVAARNLHLF